MCNIDLEFNLSLRIPSRQNNNAKGFGGKGQYQNHINLTLTGFNTLINTSRR